MRIGLSGGAADVDTMIRQAQHAEADGFAALWYASAVGGDPLVAMAMAGRATSTIELGTAVLQTYPCHPLLQANRVAAAANAMGRPGLTVGLGPSHEPVIRGAFGLPYDTPGRDTEEYLRIIGPLLNGQQVDFDGSMWTAHSADRMVSLEHRAPVLVSAMSPRLLRAAGELTDGVVLWMASAKAIAEYIAPQVRRAAADAGRPPPRIVAGLPVAVHDRPAAAAAAVDLSSPTFAGMSVYRRIIEIGGGRTPSDVAIVGNEASVEQQLHDLLGAGATDIWAQPVSVGPDRETRRASVKRTRTALSELACAGA